MSSIKIKFGSSEYMVTYEYQPAQKGDAETQPFGEAFIAQQIREVLNDGDLSDDLIGDFSEFDLMEVETKIAHEIKHSY